MSNLYIARSGVITNFPIMSQHATSTTSWGRIRISIIHFPLKLLALFPTPFLAFLSGVNARSCAHRPRIVPAHKGVPTRKGVLQTPVPRMVKASEGMELQLLVARIPSYGIRSNGTLSFKNPHNRELQFNSSCLEDRMSN
ncbi:hypothetical protein M9H77_09029 [Catharanthus roseus]|uniref:Uncharacterized protein n=1 Tax=Catharanthus roseus TaxID=4058 RepID=A0ACC0BZF7_CATRO|nr:hypothetical protein M9H77_09029 [Catharanthus roseus]